MSRRGRFKIPDWPRDRPTVDKIKPLVRAIYARPGGGAGCCLHIVLEDRNIHDESIRFCLERGCCPLCRTVAEAMLQMTKTQRRCL